MMGRCLFVQLISPPRLVVFVEPGITRHYITGRVMTTPLEASLPIDYITLMVKTEADR